MTLKRDMTIAQAARHVGLAIATLRRFAPGDGPPHGVTRGGHRRYSQAELDDWQAARHGGGHSVARHDVVMAMACVMNALDREPDATDLQAAKVLLMQYLGA